MTTPSQAAKGVLFDLDGTLLDTADDLGSALNHVLNQRDFPSIKPERYRPVASDGAKGLLELGFGQQLTQFCYDELRAEFLAYYQHHIADNTCLYPGVEQLLNTLNQRNIPWGIVTNKPEGLTLSLLPHFPEFAQCKVVVGGDTLPTRKPDPQPLLFAVNELNIEATDCLYIGDALRDIEAGNRAQMITIVAQWGYIKASDDTSLWQANYIAENSSDCLTFI
ncbi:HAD-IA family hydrolase [Thalassotalea sp. G2M2-11]|uniref:HAD family hydrolase n=1 Tax=Thalassotalea sp. G2M2-11 TaxID=2787627 RepID=UPI0019D19D34|nr:HAD-IA family hydrolase [Thalassotalea sp. G2M2-11]